ncbi:glycoside hydrolase family 43 protein [Brachybacterium alimentarium]|uniref:glycoside hydrolase family 43 protein n=1 Tax=Brachybacterium alimentarium TaxID=47845 RepID=UPI000DF1165E|nr:glycoside hydrolase family 43 protein [Brachybacterium alimentarium]RCS83549.1 glycoside hydrolase family 43 [Brachybacterium alimentarium]
MTPTAPISRRTLVATGTIGAALLGGLGTAARADAATGYTNPVITTTQPDPGVLQVGNQFFLYSTAGPQGNMPVLVSMDLVQWRPLGDAQPQIAAWSESGRHWAPEVIEVNGKFHAYYTARDRASDRQAIGVAIANLPEGPFFDPADAPLLSTPEEGGCIDASPFRDEDGSLWLLWKNDGNAADQDSFLFAQRLADDGLSLVGERTRILERDQDWEIYTIEGPAVIAQEGRYYLFYSAGEYWNATYGVGVAVADAIDGPWTKVSDTPVLAANDVAAGPGHGMPVWTRDGIWYVYHAWQPDHIGEDPGRQTWISKVTIEGDAVSIDGPRIENPVRPGIGEQRPR